MWPDKEDEVSDGQAVSAAVVISENALDIYGGETYRRTNRDPSRGRRMAFKFGIREKNGTVANSVTLKVEVIQGTAVDGTGAARTISGGTITSLSEATLTGAQVVGALTKGDVYGLAIPGRDHFSTVFRSSLYSQCGGN